MVSIIHEPIKLNIDKILDAGDIEEADSNYLYKCLLNNTAMTYDER